MASLGPVYEDTLFSEFNDRTIAAFIDGNPGTQLSDFTANIDWGDGTAVEKAEILPKNGYYVVVADDHTYT